MQIRLTLAASLAVVLFSGTAHAQFVAPMRYNEGPGIKLSEGLVFHPGISVEGRYDSNVFHASGGAKGAGYLRFIAHLHLATLSAQRLEDGEDKNYKPNFSFRVSAAAAYREYLNGGDPVRDRRGLEVDAGLELLAFPQGVFSFGVRGYYVRSEPSFLVTDTIGRNSIRGEIPLVLTPGGGRLQFQLQYAINADLFEDDRFSIGNKYFHEASLLAKWRLLPKTAIYLLVVQQFYLYYDDGGLPTRVNQDSMPLRASLGFRGLITPRFFVMLEAGYGNGFYDEFESYNMIIGQVQLGYYIGPTSEIKLGFKHDFHDYFLSNYYTQERVYLTYNHMFFNRLIAHASVAYMFRNYDGFNPQYPLSGTTRIEDVKNHVVKTDLGIDYRILDWLFVGVGYNLELRERAESTPSDLTVAFGGSVGNDPFRNFVRHQVFGKVEVSY